MNSIRLASRRLANSTLNSSLRSTTTRQALRRTYASSSGGHGKAKSSELPWALGAAAVTIPGLYFALKPSADSGHHGSDHGHEEHDDHEEKEEGGEEEVKDDEAPADDEEKAEAKSEDDGDDKEEQKPKDDEPANPKDKDGDIKKPQDEDVSTEQKDEENVTKDSENDQKGDDVVSHAKHVRQDDPTLGKKPSGILATAKEKKGGAGRL